MGAFLGLFACRPDGRRGVDICDAVACVPHARSRQSGGCEQGVGERVGQTACGDGPDRVMLRGPGTAYMRVHWDGLQ